MPCGSAAAGAGTGSGWLLMMMMAVMLVCEQLCLFSSRMSSAPNSAEAPLVSWVRIATRMSKLRIDGSRVHAGSREVSVS